MLIKPLELWIHDELLGVTPREKFAATSVAGTIKAKGKSFLNFVSRDALDLATHPRVIRIFQEAAQLQGSGASTPRGITGSPLSLLEAEKAVAQFLKTEAALFFSSKTQTFFSLLTTIASETDHIFFDEDIQAPITDISYLIGCQASPLSFRAEQIFPDNPVSKGRVLFVGEEVMNASGNFIPLSLLTHLRKIGVTSILDVSNAFLFDSTRRAHADILIGSLWQFGMGSVSVIAGSRALCELIWSRSHTFLRETALPASCYEALSVGLELLPTYFVDIERIKNLSAKLRKQLFPAISHSQVQESGASVSYLVSTPSEAITYKEELEKRGFFVEAFSLSQHRKETGVLRFWINRFTTEENIDKLSEAVGEIRLHLKK